MINLKSYAESSGERALEIAKHAEVAWRETGVVIALAPSLLDLERVAAAVDIPVYSQHVDPVDAGAHTGHVPPALVKRAGAEGSLINHSERQVGLHHISEALRMLRELELSSVVCAPTPGESAAVAALGPDAVAIEPPELIGTGIPVSRARPEVITDSLRAVVDVNPNVDLLCGAGITTGDDVRVALKLGTKGVLLASGVVKAKDPRKVLMDMAQASLAE